MNARKITSRCHDINYSRHQFISNGCISPHIYNYKIKISFLKNTKEIFIIDCSWGEDVWGWMWQFLCIILYLSCTWIDLLILTIRIFLFYTRHAWSPSLWPRDPQSTGTPPVWPRGSRRSLAPSQHAHWSCSGKTASRCHGNTDLSHPDTHAGSPPSWSPWEHPVLQQS